MSRISITSLKGGCVGASRAYALQEAYGDLIQRADRWPGLCARASVGEEKVDLVQGGRLF